MFMHYGTDLFKRARFKELHRFVQYSSYYFSAAVYIFSTADHPMVHLLLCVWLTTCSQPLCIQNAPQFWSYQAQSLIIFDCKCQRLDIQMLQPPDLPEFPSYPSQVAESYPIHSPGKVPGHQAFEWHEWSEMWIDTLSLYCMALHSKPISAAAKFPSEVMRRCVVGIPLHWPVASRLNKNSWGHWFWLTYLVIAERRAPNRESDRVWWWIKTKAVNSIPKFYV